MEGQRGSDRTERAARNQAMFREVNERLQELADAFQATAHHPIFVCECADMACSEQLEIALSEYEEIRSDGNSFLVAPGHVYPDVERLERENERYAVVAKVAEAGLIAQAADPRST